MIRKGGHRRHFYPDSGIRLSPTERLRNEDAAV